MKVALVGLSTFIGLCAAASGCHPSLPPRPTVVPFPYNHGRPHAISPPRTKTCCVHALGNGQDDSQTIFPAARACNGDGTVALLDPQYIIGQTLDLTFLQSVDFIFQGNINFTQDIPYWTGHDFRYSYQGATLMWQSEVLMSIFTVVERSMVVGKYGGTAWRPTPHLRDRFYSG